MVRPKVLLKGDGTGSLIGTFSPELRAVLRGFDRQPYSQRDIEVYRAFRLGLDRDTDVSGAHPSDEFVHEVLFAAGAAVTRRHWQKFELKKPEFHAEFKALRSSLADAAARLHSMSLPVQQRVSRAIDPSGVAEVIDEAIQSLDSAAASILRVPPAKRSRELNREVAVLLVEGVLPVLKDHGVEATARFDAASAKASPLISVLQAIGDDIGLRLATATWRNVVRSSPSAQALTGIAEANRNGPRSGGG